MGIRGEGNSLAIEIGIKSVLLTYIECHGQLAWDIAFFL